MKWETCKENQENVFSVSINDDYYYITSNDTCKPFFVEITGDTQCLVNPNNFEKLEWKPVLKNEIPPFIVETCDGSIIARNKEGFGYLTPNDKTFTLTKGTKQNVKNVEVLTVNFDNITEEYLTNVQFNSKYSQRNRKPAMFKNLTVVNKNCIAMKQMVKIDSGFEETASFQTGSALLIGGSIGFKKIVEASVKADSSATETESNSNIKKTGYEYTQELDIPPGCSCNLVIDSNVLLTIVPFTADLTRVFKNNDVRTISISGNYSYQGSSEILTKFESCTKLPVKC